MNHPRLAVDHGFFKANHPDAVGATNSRRLGCQENGRPRNLVGAEAKYGLTLTMAIPGRTMLQNEMLPLFGITGPQDRDDVHDRGTIDSSPSRRSGN